MVHATVEAAVEAVEERTAIEVAEHEQEAANRRRDGGGGGDGSGGEGGEAAVDAAVKEVERNGYKKRKQQSTTGVERLVGFPPLCRPLEIFLHFVNKNLWCKKTQQ